MTPKERLAHRAVLHSIRIHGIKRIGPRAIRETAAFLAGYSTIRNLFRILHHRLPKRTRLANVSSPT